MKCNINDVTRQTIKLHIKTPCVCYRFKPGKTQSECKWRVLHTRQDRRQPLNCHGLGAVHTRKAFIAIARRCCCDSFPEVWGGIGTRRAQPNFYVQNRRSRKHKTRVWSTDLGFSPHFRILKTEVCGKFRNPRPHRPFGAKKPQVEALMCSSVVNKSEFCRILPDSESLRSRY